MTRVLVLAVAAVLLAGGLFIARYEPLGQGSVSGLTAEVRTEIETWAEPDTTYILEHEEGGEFYAGLTFSNTGPVGVTVEQVEEIRDPMAFALYPVEVVIPPEGTILGRAPRFERWEPFEPFALGAGESRQVAIKYQFGRCRLERGASALIDSLSTRFSILGVSRHTTFNLPYVLVVQGQGRGQC